MPRCSSGMCRACRFEQMESRLPLAADLAQPAFEQPADDAPQTGGDLFLPGSIAGRVNAANGVDEAGIANVRVELLAADGRVLAETLTAADGVYDFPALAPGWYAIRETQPAGFDDGAETIGSGGGEAIANDLISAIYVAPGSDLHGYEFAEWRPVSGEATTPAAPLPDAARATPAFNLVPPTIVEWQRPAEEARSEAVAEEQNAATTTLAPLQLRRGEPIFASGGDVLEQAKFDFESVLAEGYELLAALFDAVDGTDAASADGATPTAERDAAHDQARADEGQAESPRDRAFGAAESAAATAPAAATTAQETSTPEQQPLRRVRSPLHVAGKPAA